MATKKTTSSTSKTTRNKTTKAKPSTTKTTKSKATSVTKTKIQTKTKTSSTTVKSSSNRVKKPAETTTPKTKTTSNTRRKTTNTPANNSISFTNTRISKGLTYTASYNGGNNVDFSMTLHNNEGKLVTGSMSIARIREILKPNYNIGIIGFTCGIYTFEFDRREFEQFLANNGI